MPFKSKEREQEYQKIYHLRTWAKRKVRHGVLQKQRKKEISNWFKSYKINLSCKICGEKHPACLDFHHVDGKTKDAAVSDFVIKGYSIKTILNEVNKCIILCRNCHAKTHYSA